MGNSFFSHLFKIGWPVGNCDFNENPVVHLELDFDLGFVNSYVQINLNKGCYM